MNTLFPAAWTAEPSFELNRRGAAFCGWLIWWVIAIAAATAAYWTRDRQPADVPAWLLAYLPTIVVVLLAAAGLVRSTIALAEYRLPDLPVTVGALAFGVPAAAIVVHSRHVAWLVPAQIAWSGGPVMLTALAWMLARSTAPGGRRTLLLWTRGVMWAVARCGYSLWAVAALLAARAVRLRAEPLSFKCPDRSCGLVFDDPPFGCPCGTGRLRTFPTPSRPWRACCDSQWCRDSYPTWLDFARQAEQWHVRLDFLPCRLSCRDPVQPDATGRRLLIVPIDMDAAARLAALLSAAPQPRFHSGHSVDLHRARWANAPLTVGMLRPSAAPLWAGDWDAVVIVPRLPAVSLDDVAFGLRQIALPVTRAEWGPSATRSRRALRARLVRTPRPDPDQVPYGRRDMPILGVFGATQARQVLGLPLEGIEPDRESLHRFLSRMPGGS